LRSSGTDILYGCHLLLDVYIYIYISRGKGDNSRAFRPHKHRHINIFTGITVYFTD
jgi:hypothetical protein